MSKIQFSAEEMSILIKSHLEEKTPLSIIRYGDGEMMMLDDNTENTHFILKKVLGYVPSDEEIAVMRANLITSYKECDFIGIPTERHLERADQWRHTLSVFNREIGEDVLNSKKITSIDLFYDLLGTGFFNGLFANQDRINYISCRNLDDVLRIKYNVKEVNSFIISPEPTYTSGYTGEKHFPEQFNKISEWIKNIDSEGALCLVGAGIPGKIYNNWFRDKGGVSLDIGSVFDCWAGKKTRGSGRGMDVEDLTHKL